ncbi:MAG: long-chain fatty aldehyde decarbonylase [Chitinophagaceae bacterium]|nr:long-chain fatty aldehyde decarbonylase [Chitinophagaceae bacterium]
MQTAISTDQKTRDFWLAATDILSQAINGEIVGMSNFALLTGTIDDVHEKMECVEHANCERNHAMGFMEIATKFNLPVLINQDGRFWKKVKETFARWAAKKDFIGCILIQEVILECFAVSMYHDVGMALKDNEAGQLFLAIAKEEEEHIEHSIDLLRAELEKDAAGFLEKAEAVHYDCMTIMAEWSVIRSCDDSCGICAGDCMKERLYAVELDIRSLRGNAMNLYMKTLDRIGVPGVKSLEWVANLPI